MISSTEMLRHQNRAHVLAGLRELGPSAHTTLSEWSGLSSASVSSITAELEAEGVLAKLEHVASSGRGRPRVLLGPNATFAYVAAIRITTEAVEYSLVNYAGTLVDRFHEARPAKEKAPKHFLERIKRCVARLAERSGLDGASIQLVSITTKGVVAPDSPTLIWSPVFGDKAIDFAAELQEVTAACVYLHNETTFSAQAVSRRVHRQDAAFDNGHRIAVLSLGQSIGLGVATLKSHGRVSSFAPPFGHMIDQPQGSLCRCGSNGCVEATAGFHGILRTAFDGPSDTVPARIIPLAEMDKLAARARGGEHSAEYAFRCAGDCLGLALARLSSLLGVAQISITGHGVRYIDLLLPGINRGLEQTMQARQGRLPQVHIEHDETHLVHEGSTRWALATLDETRVATRQLSHLQVVG